MRAKAILCLQTGHIGRSESEYCITRTQAGTINRNPGFGLSDFRSPDKILTEDLTSHGTLLNKLN